MQLDPVKLADHVKDAHAIELPFGIEVELPKVLGLQITKFMLLELVAAVLMIVVFVPLARKISTGKPVKGRVSNMLEVMILFVRNEVVRPAIGHHDADRFLPLILTMFFFILFCNLLGLLPWMGSPTASINVTAALAMVAFLTSIGAGMKKFGAVRFWLGLCPPMDLPGGLKIFLVPMVLVLEIVGLLIRHCILAVRLLANMFGGHLVLAMIVGFIPAMAGSLLWYGVTPLAIFGGTAISMLELFVAFLQAYIFAFLAALFIGMSVHQH
jgi:F-type H+-transporting ATPase subunit a